MGLMALYRNPGVVATYASAGKVHRNAKDISVTNLTVSFHGAIILEGCDLQLNSGNRCVPQ